MVNSRTGTSSIGERISIKYILELGCYIGNKVTPHCNLCRGRATEAQACPWLASPPPTLPCGLASRCTGQRRLIVRTLPSPITTTTSSITHAQATQHATPPNTQHLALTIPHTTQHPISPNPTYSPLISTL